MTTYPPLPAAPLHAQGQSVASQRRSGAEIAVDRAAYAVLCTFVFAIPWGDGVPLLAGYPLGRWLGLLALGLGLLRLMVTGQARRFSVLHGWMLALVAWASLSLLWTMDSAGTLTRTGTYAQLLVAVWLIWELAPTETRVLGLIKWYVAGTCVSCTGTIANFIMGRTAADLYQAAGTDPHQLWSGERYTTAGLNENDLGVLLALSIPMSLYLLARRRSGGVPTLLLLLQLTACTTALLLTGSRGSLLAAAAALLMLPLIFGRLLPRQKVTLAAGVVAACLLALFVVPQEIWTRLLSTASELNAGTLDHRTQIWNAGLEAFRGHTFLGVGSGAYGAAIMKTADIPYVAHNTFLSVLVETGVIGALLLVALLASLTYCALKMPYLERCLWITLLLTWAVGVSALTWEYHKTTWFLFGLITAHVYAQRQRRIFP